METTPASATRRRSARSIARLTDWHLGRLAELANEDHGHFTRPGGRPEYTERRLVVVLAQGAAQHYVDCLNQSKRPNGINDLDLWTFYAAIPGERFPAAKRKRVVDFGPSDLGRKRFDFAAAKSPTQLANWRRWHNFQGRVVDLMVRPLPVDPGASSKEVVSALRAWLKIGAAQTPAQRRSNWYLAQRPVLLIYPGRNAGKLVWP